MSYKAEVIADSTGKWIANGLRFVTREDAQKYLEDLSWRWTSVREGRVVESEDIPTHEFVAGQAREIKVHA